MDAAAKAAQEEAKRKAAERIKKTCENKAEKSAIPLPQPTEPSPAVSMTLFPAAEYNAELTELHVLEGNPEAPEIQSATADVRPVMENAVPSEMRDWCTVQSVVRAGRAYQEIVQLALQVGTDLVGMGVHGPNAVNLALFGSTTHRVVQLGTCPVLVVPI